MPRRGATPTAAISSRSSATQNHVEVIGTLGERPDATVVIESPEQARVLKTGKPVAVITQTTLSLDDVAPIVDALEDHLGAAEAAAADDICYATQNRQDAVKAMVAEGATLVLVIGSATSSNAQRLVEVAQAAGATATLDRRREPVRRRSCSTATRPSASPPAPRRPRSSSRR